MRVYNRILVLALVALFVGCREDGRREEEVSVTAPPGDYVVAVNGAILTAAEMASNVEMMVTLRIKSQPNLSIAELNRFRDELKATYPILFMRQVLVGECAVQEGVSVSDEVLDRFRRLAVRNARIGKAKKWLSLLKAVKPYARQLEDRVAAEALESALREALVTRHPTNWPPDLVEQQLAMIRAYNRNMDATNALIHAEADAVWKQLKAGADFGEMARTHSTVKEERKDRGKWANLDWKQIEADTNLYVWAQKLNPGEFSPPIEADNGLMIMRLDRKNAEECVMSRIFFMLPMFCAEPKPEVILATAEREYAEGLLEARITEQRKKAHVFDGNQAVARKEVSKKEGGK